MACKTITVFSNKGGVGKTFFAVNLATTLAMAKQKVLLLDLDFQAGQDMARMLNLSPRGAAVDIFPVLENIEKDPTFLRQYIATHASGLHFLPVVKSASQIVQITPDNIKPFLKKIATLYNYIIIDSGRAFSETLVTVLDSSNLLLLVTTPDILAVYQIKWCLDVLQNLQFPSKMIKIVLNRSESRGSVPWSEVRTALTSDIFAHIPSDGKAVGLALNRGVPCVMDSPRSRVAEMFNKIAGMLRNEDLFVKATDVEKLRITDGLEKPEQFWEKFGISQQVPSEVADNLYTPQQEEVIALKKKIHEKLVNRLNLDGMTPDTLTDLRSIRKLKVTAEKVVGELLIEEVGGKIGSHEERVELVKDILNEALGLGPLEDFLADPDVTDIMANNKDKIYVEKKGKLVLTNKSFISDEKMRAVIDRIIAPLGRRIDESTPMVDARLPDGSRINAIIPPLSLSGPMITIRKFGKERLGVKELLTKYGSLTQNMVNFLQACVLGRKNVIVSGGTGAGKTTLLNVISEFIPDNERIITIEDAAELKLRKSHWARLESRPPNIEGRGAVSIRDLFINCLRMRPDRIVIGECRGAEVLDMLQAMNTGHDGSMTTLHANSTRDVLTRMHSMILLSGIELPVRAINEMVSSAIDMIVHINRFSDGTRKITGITETVGLSDDFQLVVKDVFIFKQAGIDREGHILGAFQPTGYIPKCYEELEMRGLAVNKEMFSVEDSQ
ncbi:Type II/IV secretion system ATP hydrolase TadA/VirB11/CpaF, TadA subfamily [hydrothermal vent metagenome]|uniref:Type II/IV secretion system ATP hydrolase TadA/VirB11/CpaF, TadA subfamily n=1 Tax=hydrothermal vent metagenome TaxID=652676 RepID=A0A3B1E4F9_9ZZZZ